ncbi:SMP-30/gluconolactonase/LRE family protein [Streptomyces sp. NPDC090306]|uniref:SMP-30/gluconolactonase/LRE family protein n=1 Tax=Streptomyces sp. NPDC090306 TaxID=3365961 RepID=UPI0038047035
MGRGPEHVVAYGPGHVLTGLQDGRVLRVATAAPYAAQLVGSTGARPLGLAPLPDGRVLVCDAERGLLRLSRAGAVEVLVDRVGGEPLRLCSNVDVGGDGTVYFTSSSTRYRLAHWRSDLVEHTASGRLMRLAPGSSEPEVLSDGLEFANGVVVAADGAWLLVAETGARRLVRHWLSGPSAGTTDVLLDDLPGYPDNLTRGPGGTLWVALAAPANPLVEVTRRAPLGVRRAAGAAAPAVRVRPPRTVRLLGLGPEGGVRHDLRRTGPGCRMITSAAETGECLVLGSLTASHLTVCELPDHGGGGHAG